jgi:hypothetical protein
MFSKPLMYKKQNRETGPKTGLLHANSIKIMANWQHLRPLAEAVGRGTIPGFFTVRGPWIDLPKLWSDGTPVVRLPVSQGLFLAREGFLSSLGYQRQAEFTRDATANNLRPESLALAIACGPHRQRGPQALFLTAHTEGEAYTVVTHSETERALMGHALAGIFPGAKITSDGTAPRMALFPLVPPNLRERFQATDGTRRNAILFFLGATTVAVLLVIALFAFGLPPWTYIFPTLIPYLAYCRAKATVGGLEPADRRRESL